MIGLTRTISIRTASEEDLSIIQTILKTQHLGYDDIGLHINNFLVAVVDGRIAGTIGMEYYGTTGLLRSAAVASDFQNQGIGEKLVSAIEASAMEHGVREIVLLTTTAETYFVRKGFVRITRGEISGEVLGSSQFAGACPSTAASMRKKI